MMTQTPLSPWVAALIRLERNPEASVPCPACGEAPLRVLDVEAEVGDRVRVARYLVCDRCNAHNVADSSLRI